MEHPFLAEIAVHHFDSFCYLFGSSPASVFARSYNLPGSDYDHEGAAHALLEFDGGPTVQYSGTFVGSRYQYELWLETENGDVRTDRIRVWWRPRAQRRFTKVEPVALPPGEVLRYPRAGWRGSGPVPASSAARYLPKRAARTTPLAGRLRPFSA
jgi:predicted dehydrogenase